MTTAPWTDERARTALRRMFEAAVGSADPRKSLAAYLPDKPTGRCIVVGAGKAAASMAVAVEAAWPGVDLSGVVVAPHGAVLPTRRIKVMQAAHPVPDAGSEAAARAIMAAVQGLSPDDLVLALISGGGSSLMALPGEGLTLADKQAVNRLLLASGLDIRTMNMVRKRLSDIKGGKLLAAAAPARVVTLAISDIPGDDPAAIASGPTIPNPDAQRDLSALVEKLGPSLPLAAAERLLRPEPARAAEAVDFRLIATPAKALEAAAIVAREEGLEPVILGDSIEGEAREVGVSMARRTDGDFAAPTVLLSGGETTVTLSGGRPGRGGRNTEFTLALAHELQDAKGVWALAADTDGEDGASGGGAGAIATPDTLARAAQARLDPAEALARHDSGSFFDALGDLLFTGPTLTNVNDFRAVLIAR